MVRQVVDTSVVISFLRGHSPAVAWLGDALGSKRVVTTAITVFELGLGVTPGSRREQQLHQLFRHIPILALDGRAAIMAAQVERKLRMEGRPIGPADVFIAGICLSQGLPVVTQNVQHFRRIPGLSVVPIPENLPQS